MDRTELDDRLLSFSVRIIHLVGSLPHNIVGRRIGDQLLRSGTSVGANYEEAQGAESHADFTHKMQIALKEMRESNYWLRVLYTARVLAPHLLEELMDESEQLKKILSKSVATAKGKAKP